MKIYQEYSEKPTKNEIYNRYVDAYNYFNDLALNTRSDDPGYMYFIQALIAIEDKIHQWRDKDV